MFDIVVIIIGTKSKILLQRRDIKYKNIIKKKPDKIYRALKFIFSKIKYL